MNKSSISPLISICIQVFNRHDTLFSLLNDLPDNKLVEVIVFDFSTDSLIAKKNMREMVWYPNIAYKQVKNDGLDYGFDVLAKSAKGKYCWLLPDDDLVALENLESIFSILSNEAPDFLLLNSDVWTADYNSLLKESMHRVKNKIEPITELNFKKIAQTFSYIGACIFKRELWVRHSNPAFYHSFFMHVFIFGKILSDGGLALVTNIKGSHIRANNALWTRQAFIIWTEKWPTALHSIEIIPSSIKESIVALPAYNSAHYILYYYAYGALHDKNAIQDIFNLRYKIFYRLLSLIPRKIISYLVLLVMFIKKRRIVNEPSYYLLSSINSRLSNYFLNRFF